MDRWSILSDANRGPLTSTSGYQETLTLKSNSLPYRNELRGFLQSILSIYGWSCRCVDRL